MSDVAIRCEGLSKQYRIGEQERYKALRDVITDAAASPFRRLRSAFDRRPPTVNGNGSGPSPLPLTPLPLADRFWALDDVSFEVERGEVVGIIGRNGAGKSTLLKILSRITKPTKGHATMHGRVGSLLEVGTGFHPELTGRENIYLNAAILGMRKAAVARKFDEIVAFAEVEKFIDTPVKRYSSGMYVRLAFAVAAYMETEVLLVDEVLAVGDSAFQQKCLGKMGDVARKGRTVLFVSHNMAAIKSLCTRAILLGAGHVAADGNIDAVVDTYFTCGRGIAKTGIIADDAPRLYSNGEAKLRTVILADASGNQISQLYLGQPFRLLITLEAFSEIREAVIEVGITTLDGTMVTSSMTIDGSNPPVFFAKGQHTVALDVDCFLLPRRYAFLLGIHHFNGTTIDWVERALEFSVLNVSENSNDHCHWLPARGYVRPSGRWHIQNLRNNSSTFETNK